MSNLEPKYSGFVNKDGIDIYYEYYGVGDRPTLILLNGVAMECRSWLQFIPPMLEKTDVLIWDYRGQGQSTSDDKPYDIGEFADYLKAIVDELKLKPEHVNPVGVSFGSFVAVEFLRKYTESVNKCIISGVILSNETIYHYQANIGKKMLEQKLMDIWVDSLYAQLFSSNFLKTIEPYIPKMKEALYNRYKDRTASLGRLLETEESYINRVEDFYPEFQKIDKPILLIAGEQDMLTPTFVQKKITKVFPNIEYVEFPGSGHLTYMENTKEFIDRTLNFVL